MRREERVTVQGPVKKQQPDGMSHGGAMQWKGGVLLKESWGPGSLRRRRSSYAMWTSVCVPSAVAFTQGRRLSQCNELLRVSRAE